MFPIITKLLQQSYETETEPKGKDTTPELCGYYGRACRQMNKEEGANRMLCSGCGLKIFSERQTIRR